MIYELIIISAIFIIFIIVARRMPDINKKDNQGFIKPEFKKKEILHKNGNLLDMAEEYFERGDFLKAEGLYVRIVSKDPDDYKTYNRLGIIYLEQKNFVDAKDAFLLTIKHGGAKAPRFYNLALAYLGLQEYRNALEAIDKAIDLEKNNQKYLDLKNDIKEKLKKFKPHKGRSR